MAPTSNHTPPCSPKADLPLVGEAAGSHTSSEWNALWALFIRRSDDDEGAEWAVFLGNGVPSAEDGPPEEEAVGSHTPSE